MNKPPKSSGKKKPGPPEAVPSSPKTKPEPTTTFSVPDLYPQTDLYSMNFDDLEGKIRGEEILNKAEGKSAREERDIRTKLQEKELDRKFEELKKKVRSK